MRKRSVLGQSLNLARSGIQLRRGNLGHVYRTPDFFNKTVHLVFHGA
jgi:hypothetical protein